MKYCPKCRMNVRGNRELCPLCQSALTGNGEDDVFPVTHSYYRQYNMLLKLLAFATISGGIISVLFNFLIPGHGFWSLFVVFGIVCFWVMLLSAFGKRNNIPKSIMYQAVFAAIFSIVWDIMTGWHGWAIDFVIPIVFIVSMGAMIISVIVLRSPISDYIFLMLFNGMFGLIPFVFLVLGMTHMDIPSYISVVFSIISFTGLFIFHGKNILSEAQKRFHL